jgi:hypothetical protein
VSGGDISEISLARTKATVDTGSKVIYFFRKGDHQLACETRLNSQGPGYELIVTEDGASRIEPFEELGALLAREYELLQAWRAMGWRDTMAPPPTAAPNEEEDWFNARR